MDSRTKTKSAPPVAVEVDQERRVLRVQFCGLVLPQDVKRQLPRIEEQAAKLGSGFTLVTDLVGLGNMEIECYAHVTRIMDVCRSAHVGKVIRIIPEPDKDIGFGVLSLVHYRGQVPTLTCKTRDEAETEIARS